ncbi:PfkB family carbohydrate kinase [uncultured Leifsonia sp.]|uniref:PfkB family carbohydrate kinase n=1 Tax=uncultured Leifsonia sp. TaxID=340359 RepID=UPI0028D52654|nr:PfkB family carbohydrate kinase [uncultured Leifsonia sp.]
MNERPAPAIPGTDVLVVGSVNEDHFQFVHAFPRPGETVSALASRRGLGGKGANQAVAAARAGAEVRFLAKVGSDAAAADAVVALRAAGVRTDAVADEAGYATGSAAIAVDAGGENWVIVDAGANARLAPADVDAEFDTHGAPLVVLTQGETPAASLEQAARRAHEAGARFVLNLAPVMRVPSEVLQTCDPLIVNEHEAQAVASDLGLNPGAPTELVAELASVARSVVITLGAAGSVAAAEGEVWSTAGFPVDAVVDTTGAGDAFVGSLCARLALGEDLAAAMTWASAAASLSVERPGAAESYAAAVEVERRLAQAGAIA